MLLEDLLIHDFGGAEGQAAGILGERLSDFTLRNSVIYDGGGAGVRIDRSTASALVQNSTVFGMSGPGIREGAGAAGAGMVLYPAFRTDIDGERRPIGPSASWNMGVDQ